MALSVVTVPWVVPRWEPGSADRLRIAALELFAEHGYDAVTVTAITDRAGLGRRTFFRHFKDKREVLFAGSERLPVALEERVAAADAAVPAPEAVLGALAEVGEELLRVTTHQAVRAAVIAGSEELRERERTKAAEITDALARALGGRGVPPADARLLAGVSAAVFDSALQRAVSGGTGFTAALQEAAAVLAGFSRGR